MLSRGEYREKIDDMAAEINEMNLKIENLTAKIEAKNNHQTETPAQGLYSTAAKLNKIVINQNRNQRSETSAINQAEKNERSLIVKKYMDKNIRNSRDIRKKVSEEFNGVAIRNARTTVGGSILLEFENKDAADKVKQDWKPTMFGGNKGVVNLKEEPPAAFIKHVYQDISVDDIKSQVEAQCPNSEAEPFRKNQKFTGSIKVSFKSNEDFEAAKDNIVVINQHRYVMEKFNYQPRLIRCFNCHKFGHVARLCHQEESICGKCTSKDHKTKDCTVRPAQYKCFLCEGNHETGSRNCDIIRLKTEELRSGQWL